MVSFVRRVGVVAVAMMATGSGLSAQERGATTAVPAGTGGAVTVVTREDIERRNISRLDELFEGLVPGIFSSRSNTAQARWQGRGRVAPGQVAAVKVFLNGVELADGTMIATINPEFVERIEVRTGAAAGALAGYDAAGGVVLITTRAGEAREESAWRPKMNVLVSSGNESNHYGGRGVGRQRHAVSLGGGTSLMQYFVGSGYASEGMYAPQSGGRAIDGIVNVGVTRGPTSVSFLGTVWKGTSDVAPGRTAPVSGMAINRIENDTRHGMLGMVATLQASTRWRHVIQVGLGDILDESVDRDPITVGDPGPTFVSTKRSGRKISYGYTSVFDLPASSVFKPVAIVGIQRVTNKSETKQNFVTTGNPTTSTVRRDDRQVTSVIGAIDATLYDALQLSAGVQHQALGEGIESAVLPRVGAAYTHKLPLASVTLRSAYGATSNSTDWSLGLETIATMPSYTPPTYVSRFASTLRPVQVAGLEGGIDLAVTNGPRVGVTFFDQRGKYGAISVVVDSIELMSMFGGTTYARQYQARSEAEYQTRGFEVTGRWEVGPVLANAVYSLAKTEITHVPDGASSTAYPLNQAFSDAPRAMGGAEVVYRWRDINVGAEARYVGSYTARDYLQPTFTVKSYPAFATYNLNVSQAVRGGVRAFVYVKNIAGSEHYSATNNEYVRGRVVGGGIRLGY